MDDTAFIAGLMATDYDAVGFIPHTTLADRYIRHDRYVIQTDLRGRRVGYILHGKPTPGGLLTIPQALIDVDRRLLGFGEQAVETVLERARAVNCRAIKVRVAEDLPSLTFWQSMGFVITKTEHPDNARQRAVHTLVRDSWPTLFEGV